MAKPLRALAPHHHQAVALRLAGESPKAIADQLGVELRTVYLWFSDALVKEQLQRRSEQLADVVVARMADHALAAVDQLRAVVELPVDTQKLTPEQKLEAIREILDRCPRTARFG